MRANLHLLNALKLQQISTIDQALSEFDKSLNLRWIAKTEIREQLVQFALGVGGANIDPNLKDKVLRRTLLEAQANVSANLQDPRSYLFLGALYSRLSGSDAETQQALNRSAIETFEKALSLSPTKQQIYFELASVYARQNDSKKTIEILKKAYELDPSFNMAHMNLVSVYILNQQQDEADAILEQWYQTVDVPDSLLVQTYSRMFDLYKQQGNTRQAAYYGERLVRVWQSFVKNEPNNIEHRKQLITAYLTLGQQSNAQKALNEALQSHPEFKAGFEEFLKKI